MKDLTNKEFIVELQKLIEVCNQRLKKMFDIQRSILRILDMPDKEQFIDEWDIYNFTDTLRRLKRYIRQELDIKKQHQDKLKETNLLINK